MTEKRVCTDDPIIVRTRLDDPDRTVVDGELQTDHDAASVTFRLVDGSDFTIESGESLIDEVGNPVGIIDRIHHATGAGLSWAWTVDIDYAVDGIADPDTGGVPLGEIAAQMERGILLTAR